MKVSVIIPVYNEEKVIGECLASLAKQTYKEMEVIVVDDGSTDNTLRVIRNFQFPISNFQLLKQNHNGPGEARNLGANNAKGEILVFVDADMTFSKDFVKELVNPIISGQSKGTFSREEYVNNPDNLWSQCWGINEGWDKGRRHQIRQLAESDTQKVFRAILKSEFHSVGGFDKGGFYTDDWSLSEKLGYEATLASGAKFYHKNPDTLSEVFDQSKWVAKRPYKLGVLGSLVALVRVSLPVSALVGIAKSLIHTKPQFFLFKLIYDLGAFIGILEYTLSGKGGK